MVFLMLLFAVPFWGLQYKLSLYHSIGEDHSMPAAKLLSEKERPVATPHLNRLAPPAAPEPMAPNNLSSGSWTAGVLGALLACAFRFIAVVIPGEMPRLCAPVVSRSGLRGPPLAA